MGRRTNNGAVEESPQAVTKGAEFVRTQQEGLYMITKIVSGKVVERRKTKITRRPAKRGGRIRGNSSEKKLVGNREYAKLQLARTFNCNMVPGDLWLTAKFDQAGLETIGGTYEGAKKAGRNFIDRLVYRVRKMGLVCKWVLAPSEIDGETGELVRPHVHIVISGAAFSWQNRQLFLGEETVDNIWGLGSVDVQFLRHQEDYYPLAAYLINQARGVADEKKWTCSRNMKKPIVQREIVTSGGQLRVPAGATELPGTRYDPEKNQNFVRYIPKRKDPRKKIGGHKEMALAMAEEWGPPRRSPAQRVRWGEDEQRSEKSTKVGCERSGVCEDEDGGGHEL